jgi:hypothetical protein
LGFAEPDLDIWRRFLTGATERDPPAVLVDARGTDTVASPLQHLQVISRAALLLRIATGACDALLRASSFGITRADFWLRQLGEDRGLWEPGSQDDYGELWDDVQGAVEAIEKWRGTVVPRHASYAGWRKNCPGPIAVLAECERILLWGLGT